MLQKSVNSWKQFSSSSWFWKCLPSKSGWDAWRSWREVRWMWPMRQNFVAQFVQLLKCWLCDVWLRIVWRRIGPILLTNRGCRHCSFWCISLICWAHFSDVIVLLVYKAVAIDHQWLWPFWCNFGFGKCFGTSSQSNHWASHHWLPYKIHFSL